MKIAITGGIGSGKTTVAEIIAEQGYNVVSCDKIYQNLLNDESFLNLLSAEFEGVVNNGTLNRAKLADEVFGNAEKLKKLNSLTHPMIMDKAFSYMQSKGLNFCEVPLLFEEGYENCFDRVIVVLREKDSRISAVGKRDNIDRNKIIKRINNQVDYDNGNFTNYYVIHNSGGIDMLRKDTLQIIEKLKN